MKKREFLKAAGTLGGASALGALPFSTLAQLAQSAKASFADQGSTTGNARRIEDGFMIGTNRNSGQATYGFIFTVGSLDSIGKLMDDDDEVQPIFALRTQTRVIGPMGYAVYLWVEADPTTMKPAEGGMSVVPNDDSESSVFVRRTSGRRDPGQLKRAISAGQVAKAAVGSMAVQFTSQMTGQIVANFASVYVPRWGKALLEKLAGEPMGQALAETIAKWVQTGVGIASTLGSAAYTAYMTYGLGKWMYQNPHRIATPMGALGMLLYFGPPILSLLSAALPHIPKNQPDKIIPPNIAAVWAASYGRSAAQNVLKDLAPGIEVPPIIEVINSNSQLVITFDSPQFGLKILVAFAYYGVTYGIGAATDRLNALDLFQNSEVLGVVLKSTASAAGEAIDGAVSALANSVHPYAKYTYNNDLILNKALDNSRNLYTLFAAWAFHRDVGSRVLNINTGFINYFMDHDTDLSFYGVSATSNVANALVSFRKVWLLMAETALHPTTSSTPSYASPEGVPITSVSYRAVFPAADLYITRIGIGTYPRSFPIRTDRDQVTTVTVEMPIEVVPPGG